MLVSPVCEELPADVVSALRCGYLEQLLLLGVLLSCSSVLVSGLDAAALSSHTLELLCSVSVHKATCSHTPFQPDSAPFSTSCLVLMLSVQRLKVTTHSVTWSPSREPSRHMTLLCGAVSCSQRVSL